MKRPPAEWGSTIFVSVQNLEDRYAAARHAADAVARLRDQAREVEQEVEALHRLGVCYGDRLTELNARRTKLRRLLPDASNSATNELHALHAGLFGGWRWLRDRARRVGIPLDESGDYWKRPYADFLAALKIVERAEAKMRS